MKRVGLLALVVGLLMALTAGVAVAATINGTSGDDTLRGTEEADEITGFRGDDSISGRQGDDRIMAGPGNDEVFGDRGGDTIKGRTGADELQGGRGNDDISAGNDMQTDFVFCGRGTDVARIQVDDLVDGEVSGESLLNGVNTVTSCETIFVNGIEVTNPVTTR